jgi:membrane protein DedA with SNARE-associated domain
MPPLLQHLAPLLDHWGYFAVFAIIFVESFGIPTPGQTIMVAAAVYANYGTLNVWVVALVALVAAVLGDNLGYWIGSRGGRTVVDRWGKYVLITEERFAKAEGFFARRGGGVVLIARFIDGLRQVNGIIAGITSMPWRRFLLYNTLGATLWVGFWVTLAYTFGAPLVAMLSKSLGWWAAALLAAAAIVLGVVHLRRSRQRIPS